MDNAARTELERLAQRHLDTVPVVPVPVACRERFLPPELHAGVLAALVEAEPCFRSNQVPGRRGLVLTPPPPALAAVADLLAASTAALAAEVGLPPAEVTPALGPSLLCSAHGHGDFLGPHADVLDHDGARGPGGRVLTMVLHLFRTPAAFEGGALRLYDHRLVGDRSYSATSFVEVPVRDNVLVAYRSSVRHEVTTVRMVPDAPFADRRFAISAFGTWAP